MQAFEIGHLRRVAGFHQCLEAAADEFDQAAAQHHLLTEQIGLAFLAESGFDDAGAPAADGRSVSQAQIVGVAAGVLMDGDQARHAAALLVFAAHRVAGPLGRDHQDVEVLARLDQAEMHVEAVGEEQCRALFHVGGKIVLVDVGLQFVGRHHHHGVGPFGGLGGGHHFEAGGFRLLG